jgi:hypothetical protein
MVVAPSPARSSPTAFARRVPLPRVPQPAPVAPQAGQELVHEEGGRDEVGPAYGHGVGDVHHN